MTVTVPCVLHDGRMHVSKRALQLVRAAARRLESLSARALPNTWASTGARARRRQMLFADAAVTVWPLGNREKRWREGKAVKSNSGSQVNDLAHTANVN